MRWWLAGLCVLSVVTLLGCPHAYLMGDGTLDRAARKDIQEWKDLGKCPPQDELEELCEAIGDPKCFPECQ